MDGAERAGARRWAVSEVRRRWLALAVLGILAGSAAGFAMAAVAGARRSDDAYERFRDATLASDAIVFASQVEVYDPDWDAVAALPYVKSAGAFGLAFIDNEAGTPFIPVYGSWLDDVDRPRILEGRRPNQDDPTELLATPDANGDALFEVGDEIPLDFYSTEQLMSGSTDPAAGPHLMGEVVGIGVSSFELSSIPSEGAVFGTRALGDVALRESYAFSNLMVRLEDPEHDVARLAADATRILGVPEVPVLDLAENAKRVTNGTALERDGLWLFAAAVAIAGVALVGQALSRSVRSAAGDIPALRAMGFTRNGQARALLLPHLAAVGVAVVSAVVAAVAISPLFPIGLSGRVDPDMGLHADWPVLLIGALGLSVVLSLGVVVSAVRVTRYPTAARPRASRLTSVLARSSLPLPMAVGAGLAFEPGRGARGLPTRPAIAGTIIGVMGVVGALTLAVGIDDAAGSPERFGMSWDLEVMPDDLDEAQIVEGMTATRDRAMEDADVSAVATMWRGHAHVDGESLPIYSVIIDRGAIDLATYDGRRPDRPGEIALGPATAKALGVEIGDSVAVGPEEREFEVVGLALLVQTPHSSFDQGAWLHHDDLQALGESAGSYPILAIRFSDRDHVDELVASYRDAAPVGVIMDPPAVPADATNLHNVRTLPIMFAVFTMLLAAAVIGHVATSTVRRRRGDLAVLRALGFTPRQTLFSLLSQATTLAVIGVAVGVPLGLAAGRVVWRAVAESTPLIYVPPTSVLALVLALPLALLVANLLAAWPGRTAARMPTGAVLRSE